MQLADQSMGELGFRLVTINHLLEDVFQVGFDKRFHIFCLHIVDVLHQWEETIVWLPDKHLSQIAFAFDEIQVFVLLSLGLQILIFFTHFLSLGGLSCAKQSGLSV